jgi:hypothetical protein
MSFIDIIVKGTHEEIEHATLLIERALRVHRTDDVVSAVEPTKVTRYITFDSEQTLPLKPVAMPDHRRKPQ